MEGMNNLLFKKYSFSKIFLNAIFFTLYFPFIPGIIPNTDTQPLFLLFNLIFVIFISLNKYFQNIYLISNNKYILDSIIILIISFIIISTNAFLIEKSIYWTRYISFLQFVAAILFGIFSIYFVDFKTHYKIIILYAVLTIFYFVSNGFLENLLISSRSDSFEALKSSGRGARTLSPEPSFFALHIFNIFLIYKLAFNNKIIKYENHIFILTLFCLIFSFSGYGFALALILLLYKFPKIILIISIIVILFLNFFLKKIESLQNFRALSLIIDIVKNDPLIVLKSDKSFYSRLESFNKYIDSISSHFIIGDTFTLFQGGGFISLISAFGILAMCFFLFIIFKICFGKLKIKLLLILWLLINFISGPIGIPTLGFIIGLIMRNNKNTLTSFNTIQIE
jgi:hypothetical protein